LVVWIKYIILGIHLLPSLDGRLDGDLVVRVANESKKTARIILRALGIKALLETIMKVMSYAR
jgi:hypothetical protein